MTVPGLSAALLTILIAGLGATLVAARGQTRVNLAEICALSWFFGTGVISLLLWAGGMFLTGAALQGLVTLLALGLGAFGLIRARKKRMRAVIPSPSSAVEWILAVTIALQFAVMLDASFSSGLGWDGLLNWEIKARYAFLNNGVMPAAYFSDASRDFTHQAYPLWIPLTELWLYLWMGEAHQFWLKLLFVLFYVAGAVLLITLASRLTSRRWIGLLTAALLFFVPCLTTMPGGAEVGYVDVPIGMLYLAAIGYLVLAAERNDPSCWRIYALCLALLPWAKREGAVLWAIAALCGILIIGRIRRVRLAGLWLLPGPAIMLAWKAFYFSMGKTEQFEFLPMTLATLVKNFPRTSSIGQSVIAEMMDTTHWSIFWPLTAAVFLWLLLRAPDWRLLILFLAVSAPLFIDASMYLFSGWPNWTEHVEQSLSRLLLQVMPVMWLAVALGLRPPQPRAAQLCSPTVLVS
jgi:hypothetical protein